MKKNRTYVTARNPKEIAGVLGIETDADAQMMLLKADLSDYAVNAIRQSGLTVNEIVKLSGVARSKVSFVKNGGLAGVSCELFMKIILSTGKKLHLRVA